MDKHSDTNQYTKNLNLNKLSHKISKPIKKQSLDQNPTPPPPPPSQPPLNQNQQHQPPVYNINKNDFRDVVQKLTGSPAHERFSTPPPIQPPKPQSSRLQRIRPPPLAQVSNRPPPLLNSALTNSLHFPPLQPPPNPLNSSFHRPTPPLSPLPPLPAHAAAESPVSAYMRYLQNSIPTLDSNKAFAGFAPLVSPRWSNQNQPPPLAPPSPTAGFQVPSSPAPFGCLNSPRSPYGLVSPSSFPLSPTVALPSPKWRGL